MRSGLLAWINANMNIENIPYEGYLPDWIYDSMGKMVGDGAEGHVYEFGKNRIIKIASLGDGFIRSWGMIKNVLESLVRNPKPDVVRIYFYGILNTNPLVYFYVAEKLKPISWVQRDIIDNCVENDEVYYDSIDDYDQRKIAKNKKLLSALESLTNQKRDARYRFNIYDIHSGNIMKDVNNNFKLCDVGLIEIKKKWSKRLNKEKKYKLMRV